MSSEGAEGGAGSGTESGGGRGDGVGVCSAGNLRVIYGRGVSHNFVAVSEEHTCKRVPPPSPPSLLLCLSLHTALPLLCLFSSSYSLILRAYQCCATLQIIFMCAVWQQNGSATKCAQRGNRCCCPLSRSSCNYRVAHTRSREPLIYGQQRPLTARATSCGSIAEAARCTLQLINVERAACGPN